MSESAQSYSAQRLEEKFDAYVLLSEPLDYKLADLAEALSGACASVAEWQLFMDAEGWGQINALADGESIGVTVFGLAAPVPVDHYATCVRRAITFPGAQSALEGHQAHIAISAGSDGKDLVSRFKAARIVTCVSAMFARLDICTAILFPSGDVIAEPGAWQDAMQMAMSDEWPVGSWISYEIQGVAPEVEGGVPAVACSSVGMAAFNGHEVTFAATPVAPATAAEQVFGAIYLLLQSGNEFSDGDTMGVDDGAEKLRLRYAAEGHLGVQTNTWVILHPNCLLDEGELFSLTESVPPPPGLDTSVQPQPGFFSRLLRLGRLTH